MAAFSRKLNCSTAMNYRGQGTVFYRL